MKLSIRSLIIAFSPFYKVFQSKKSEIFVNQPLKVSEILVEHNIKHLPSCVRKYLAYTGSIGKPIPQNVYIEFDASMYQKQNDKPMKSNSKQYNFYGGDYSRLFLMKSSKMGICFQALHIYKDHQASFKVKLAGMLNIVNINGNELTKAETVTFLNDMCFFAPANLVDKRLAWEELSPLSVKVTLTNSTFTVSAILYFNERGELINFISDDRSALQPDGTMKVVRWSTPVGDYRKFDERWIPTYGKTIWHYPEGEFTYGVFILKKINYNVTK